MHVVVHVNAKTCVCTSGLSQIIVDMYGSVRRETISSESTWATVLYVMLCVDGIASVTDLLAPTDVAVLPMITTPKGIAPRQDCLATVPPLPLH